MRAPLPQTSLSSIVALSLLSLAACSSSIRAPSKTPETYPGPPLTIDSTPPQHRVILTAPAGGWSFVLDQTVRRFDRTDVFVTITRPNPAFMHTQAQVRQEVGTQIDPAQPIAVYARILNFDAKPGSQPYSLIPAAQPSVP